MPTALPSAAVVDIVPYPMLDRALDPRESDALVFPYQAMDPPQ